MARIILHDQQYKIGGPAAVLKGIESSLIGQNHQLIRLVQPDSCGFNPIKAFRFIWHYSKEISRHNADAIYICGLQYIGLLMVMAAKLSNVKKVVLSVHGSEWDNPDGTFRKWLLMHIVEPLEVFLCDSVFTVCEAAQRSIGALKFARKGHNAGVVYNTMPASYIVKEKHIRQEFKIPCNKTVITIVGRVVKAKGHDYVIEAIKGLDDKDCVFMIVGDGDYVDVYKSVCAEEIQSGRLILAGIRHDVNDILAESDIFLFATLNENHSIALLEAVNMRCAVLCTSVGGNPEIIEDGRSGLLMPPRKSAAIIEGVKRLKDRDLRIQFAENAYSSAVSKFSISNTYGKLEKILIKR